MPAKPSYEELERRVQALEKLVSEQSHSKKSLPESERLFKMLYENAPLGYQSLDEKKPFSRADAGLSLTALTVGCDEYLSIRELLVSPGFSQSVVAIWQLMGIIWVGLFRIGHLGGACLILSRILRPVRWFTFWSAHATETS